MERRGLPNLGQTCFLNAATQILLACDEIAAPYLSGEYAKSLCSDGEFSHAFAALARSVERRGARDEPHRPEGAAWPELRSWVDACARHIDPGYAPSGGEEPDGHRSDAAARQPSGHDAMDCLEFVIEALHDDANRARGDEARFELEASLTQSLTLSLTTTSWTWSLS